VVGGDGAIWTTDSPGGDNTIDRIDPVSRAVTQYNTCTGSTPTQVAASGNAIYYLAPDPNGIVNQIVGSFPVTQNPSNCIPKSREAYMPSKTTTDPLNVLAIAGDGSGTLWWAGTTLSTNTPEVGTVSGTSVTAYPMPASWPSNASPAAIFFNSADGYVYFDDQNNGIIGRIPDASPSTASIAGYGRPHDDGLGTQSFANFPDALTVNGGYLYYSSLATSSASVTSSAIGIINLSRATFGSSPVRGMAMPRGGRLLRSRAAKRRTGAITRP